MIGNHRDWTSITYEPAMKSYGAEGLIARLPREASVLEIGCYDGAISRSIARQRPDTRVFGVDINEAAIADAQASARTERLENVRFEMRDALELPAAAFDAVVTIRVLTCFPEIDEWTALLQSIERCLRPAGEWHAIDFQFDVHNPVYADRYAAGERAGWRRGNFLVRKPCGQPLFIAHHHTEEDLALLRRQFLIDRFRRFEGHSMNGNPVAMFEQTARRRSVA